MGNVVLTFKYEGLALHKTLYLLPGAVYIKKKYIFHY